MSTKRICVGNFNCLVALVYCFVNISYLLWRTIYAVYEKDEEYDGLIGRKLVVPKSVLENRTNAPENACFCVDENDEGKCPNTGAMF